MNDTMQLPYTKCDYCNKVATYNVMGDQYSGDHVIGYCCMNSEHLVKASDRDDCHHFEQRSMDDILADMRVRQAIIKAKDNSATG